MNYPHIQYGSMYPVFDPGKEYEISLVNQWLSYAKGTVFKTVTGESVFILHPGRRNRHEGPDIYDAVLQINGKMYTGEIECHLDSKDWFRHGHDKQNTFAEVILHVVRTMSSLKTSPKIPTLVLNTPEQNTEPIDCSLQLIAVTSETISSLHYLSEMRWQSHVKKVLKKQPNDIKTLLILSTGLFGMGRNKEGFTQIADHVDIKLLNRLSENESVQYIEQIADSLSIQWFKKGVRPASHPENRFKTLISLIHWMTDTIDKIHLNPNEIGKSLSDVLKPHCGEGLIVEILGNVIYPYLGAKAVSAHDIPLFNTSKDLWFELKLPYSYMKYEKQFQDVFSSKELRSFSFLQGLKALDSHYCKSHYCKLCPLKEGIDDLV